MIENTQKIAALSGRLVSTLDQGELQVLHHFYEQGRKLGVSINFHCDGVKFENIDSQLRSVLVGDKATPIWRENTIIEVKQNDSIVGRV